MKTREDFLLDVRAAVKRNQVVVMMLHNTETGEFGVWSNSFDCDFDDVLSSFLEMPFIGHIPVSDAFEEWGEYYENLDEAEIYGFELEDGIVQIALLDYYIVGQEEAESEK